ncbi:hypothetical protein GOBAR_DD02349 [Gossypium barbadense]|nr:hypothetical protein GOBAR_DD02349 [Gossypium barbadense]
MKCKGKRLKGGNRENNEESPAILVQRKLADSLSPYKAVARVDVAIQNYSSHHIDSLIRSKNHNIIRFTGFYGHPDPNLRNWSWDILKRVGRSVREDWFVGGDFNTIVNDAEKEGDRKKSRGDTMVKERLDRFLISVKAIVKFPFLDTNMENEAKNIIKAASSGNDMNTLKKLKKVGVDLGPWQHNRENNANMLKTVRIKLGHLYAKEECYWAQSEPNLSFMDKSVTEDINIMLARDLTDDEILDAFNQMDHRKAPRIDGF